MKLSNYKKLLLPGGVILILIVVGLFVTSFIIGRINLLTSETRDQEAKNQVLEGRLTTLQSLSPEIRGGVNNASIAIPDKNPSVLIANQVKSLAAEHSVGLSNLSITMSGPINPTAEVADQLIAYNIEFEAVSLDYQSLFSFVTSLSTASPIMNLASLSLENVPPLGVEANINLLAYSASFPEELPALDEPLVGLTPEETQTLNTIQQFKTPEISEPGVSTSPTAPRANPFTL